MTVLITVPADHNQRNPQRWRGILGQWLTLGADSYCHLHEIGKGPSPHLTHHPASMRLDGDLADPELAADLLVQLAGNDQIHHLPLAIAECFITVTKRACLGFRAKRDFTALNRPDDRAQKLVAVDHHGCAPPELRPCP